MAVSGPGAIDPAPGQGRNTVEDGRARLFCFALQRRRSRRRKKAGAGRCGWRSRRSRPRSHPTHRDRTGRTDDAKPEGALPGPRHPSHSRETSTSTPSSAHTVLSVRIPPSPFRNVFRNAMLHRRIAKAADGCVTNDLRDRQSQYLDRRHHWGGSRPHAAVAEPGHDGLAPGISRHATAAFPVNHHHC